MRIPLTCLIAAVAAAVVPWLRAAPADADPFEQTDPFVRASAALARGDLAAAEALALPLASGAAPRADVCTLLGEVRLGQKRPWEAIEFFEKAAQLSPKSAICQSRLGTAILESVGQAEPARRGALVGRALAALNRSVELEPDHYDGCLALAHFYAEAPADGGRDFDRAAFFAEKVRKANPFEGTLQLAIIAERQGRLEAALERYRETLRMWDDDPGLLACEARVLANLGRIAEARACYGRILQRFPDWAPGRQALAALPADSAAK